MRFVHICNMSSKSHFKLVFFNKLAELPGACYITPLSYVDKVGVWANSCGLQACLRYVRFEKLSIQKEKTCSQNLHK